MMDLNPRQEKIQSYIVTAEQMRQIEARVFAAGMPVAALMEKVAGLITRRIQTLYPYGQPWRRVGVLVGPGHNGGDALVIARELQFRGYEVLIYSPFDRLKELTATHAQYAAQIGISRVDRDTLQTCDGIVDGFFGFGLTRPLEGTIATDIDTINQWSNPVVSIDLPSGLHTDTGQVLGTAVQATHTLCLGLWKRAFLQDGALEYIGIPEFIDFDLPLSDIQAVLGSNPTMQRLTSTQAIASLPLRRSLTTYKYQQGHLLVIAGSRSYGGAAILTGLAARSSGVGMLSIAVPQSLKPILTAQIPDALVIGCPETETGAIAQLPPDFQLDRYDAIACGPGLTQAATAVVTQVLSTACPVILDADGLNILAQLQIPAGLNTTIAPRILTPHAGEFKRLFPNLTDQMDDRLEVARSAAQRSGAIVLLKGARVAIATPQGRVWVNPDSTPALARGGSGDVLTGLIGGLVAQAVRHATSIEAAVCSGTWWHAQAAMIITQARTEIGVDAMTLAQGLLPALHNLITI